MVPVDSSVILMLVLAVHGYHMIALCACDMHTRSLSLSLSFSLSLSLSLSHEQLFEIFSFHCKQTNHVIPERFGCGIRSFSTEVETVGGEK